MISGLNFEYEQRFYDFKINMIASGIKNENMKNVLPKTLMVNKIAMKTVFKNRLF